MFILKTGKTKKKVVELAPCAKNKWGVWTETGFMYIDERVKAGLSRAPFLRFSLRSSLFLLLLEKDRGDHAFGFATVTCSGRDLVEEFLVCEIWSLCPR